MQIDITVFCTVVFVLHNTNDTVSIDYFYSKSVSSFCYQKGLMVGNRSFSKTGKREKKNNGPSLTTGSALLKAS